MHRLLLGTALLACEPFGPGGAPPEPPKGQGQLFVDTDSLNFGEVSVGDSPSTSLGFVVRNSGTGLLKVAGLNHPLGDSEAFRSDAPPLLELQPNESQTINVAFLPQSSSNYSATLLPNGLVEITLSGIGLAPKLATTPTEFAFESQPVGCNQQQQLVLENTGDEPLTLESIAISGSSAFVVDSELPVTLLPGEESESILVFSPQTGGMHSAVLSIESNDPLHPTTVFPLEAVGYEGEQVQESHFYQPTGRTDFLFLLNERASVRSHLSTELTTLEDFVETLSGLDWRIAVSNMDAACTLGSQPWIEEADPLSTNVSALHSALTMPGSGGTALFDKATLLLERTDPGDCLDGFLRSDSLLQLIFVTDQMETSSGSVGTHLQDWEDQLLEDQGLAVSSLSGKGFGSCSNSPRLAEATASTDGHHHDLCSDSLDGFLTELSLNAQNEVETSVSLTLEENPVVSTLSLSHEGEELHSWQYLSSTNRIVLDGEANALTEGDEIELNYLSAVDCE